MVAVVVFALLMIGAAIWITRKDKRWTRQPPDELAADASTVPERVAVTDLYWLQRNPETERFVARMEKL